MPSLTGRPASYSPGPFRLRRQDAFAITLVAVTFTLAACSSARSEDLPGTALPATPVAGSTLTPPRSLVPTPPFDPGAPFVVVPSQPQAAPSPLPSNISPRPSATETPAASSSPRPSNQVTITRQDDRKTIEASVDDLILVQLGNDFRWRVQPPDPSVLMPVSANLPVGAQALYVAKRPGPVELAATGTANCPPGVACPLFAILFKVEIVIH